MFKFLVSAAAAVVLLAAVPAGDAHAVTVVRTVSANSIPVNSGPPNASTTRPGNITVPGRPTPSRR
jgi:hypothetical protein